MKEPRNVPIEAVMALTGLTKRQVIAATREGRIPGAQMVGRTFSMPDLAFEALRRNGVQPKRPSAPNNPLAPTDFFKTMKEVS